MEFLRGQDLAKRMRAEPPLTLEQKIEIIAELCTGLHFAHEQGVIHRDVKPANIWLVPDGSVKLLDFGIAKFSSSTMTRQGSVLGSISYMSPEQVNGIDVDGRADVFSAGVVLFELLSGKKPFSGDSPTAVLARIMDDRAGVAPTDLPADIPKPLVAAVMKALQKDREKRYRHAADFGADLRLVRSALVASGDQAASEIDFAETGSPTRASVRTLDSGTTSRRASWPWRGRSRWPARRRRSRRPPRPRRKAWLVPAAVRDRARLPRRRLDSRRCGRRRRRPRRRRLRRCLVKIPSRARPGARIAVNGVDTGRVTPADVEVDPARLRFRA